MNSSFMSKNVLKRFIDKTFLPVCAAAIALVMTPAFSQQNDVEQAQASEQIRSAAQPIYGRQLMTEEEN